MAVTINKQRILNQLFSLGKHQGKEPAALPVLEQLLYAVCREGTTRALADRAFADLRDRFFDWNEVRVSSPRELEEVLADLPDAEIRAQRIISLLQEVFETTFSFDLESLHKKGLKQAAKHLARYQAADDYAVAWVVQHSLAGHAVPLDTPTLRILRRLGVLDSDTDDLEALRASLEHLVPKARGALFSELVSALAADYCEEVDPRCNRCPLARECMTVQEAATVVTAGRTKPR
jgi:endonuclease-3